MVPLPQRGRSGERGRAVPPHGSTKCVNLGSAHAYKLPQGATRHAGHTHSITSNSNTKHGGYVETHMNEQEEKGESPSSSHCKL